MIQEDKNLLLVDLSARLPYKPKIQWDCADYDLLALENCEPILARIIDNRPYSYAISKPLEEIKPYLRPMSSMTEEEKEEYCNLQDRFLCSSQYPVTDAYALFDWLNAHHFDYRGLIERGLALEAPGGMYNIKEQ